MRVPECSPSAYRRLALANLVLLAIIIVTGAAVRLSESGLGCSEWPRCNPDDFVSVGTKHEAIEQLNRLFSGAIVVPIALLLFFAYRRRPRRRDLVALCWAMLALFMGNAVLGGITVMVKLAWVSVMGHFLLAIALVAAALIVYRRSGEPDGPRHWVVSPLARTLALVVYALTLWVLVVGTLVTAVGPHGGDREAKRLDWQLTDVARVHSVSVDILVGVVIVLVVVLWRQRAPRPVLTTVSVVLAAMIAQGILGYVQYFQAIPALLVGFHVAGAVLVFGSVQWLVLELRAPDGARPDAAPRPDRSQNDAFVSA